ncbi:MAG: DUF21 domain-containing protein, partial [Hyphomicrobiaceae bacterium]|nr:DUF21 domain-containing protein [Hyphomicrobiaceae bacterium]
MSVEITLTLAAILLLLVLSAFFSGSETALTAVSRARMHALELEGNQRARAVNNLLAVPERIIGTVLLGNNLVNVLASALTTSLLISLFGEFGVAYATIIMTALVVIFAEVLPKTYALAFPDRISLSVAPVMGVLIVVLKPLTITVEFIVRQILKLTPSRVDDKANILAAHEEIRGTIELQTKEGAVARYDADMLGGVLDLRDMQVADIMVHRTKMETMNAEDPPQDIVDALLKTQYTRVPIWKDEPENIVGVLHTKDLFSALGHAGWDVTKLDVMSLAVQPWFVPDTTGLKDQLNQFLKRKAHFALVVDEYGVVQGLVTLEDILEEIVGDIID